MVMTFPSDTMKHSNLSIVHGVVSIDVLLLRVVESTTSYTFPVLTGGIFYFPWDRRQMEGTGGF